MKSDLKNVASQQEIYWSDFESYTADFDALGFVASNGVDVTVHATADSWAARATHQAPDEREACWIWWGEEPPVWIGLEGEAPAGEIMCNT